VLLVRRAPDRFRRRAVRASVDAVAARIVDADPCNEPAAAGGTAVGRRAGPTTADGTNPWFGTPATIAVR
jgi:hypothetical protein